MLQGLGMLNGSSRPRWPGCVAAVTITGIDHSLDTSPSGSSVAPGARDGTVGTVPSPLLPSSRNPLPGHTEWTWALPGAWHFLPGLRKEGQGTESRPQCVPSGSCPSPPPEGGRAPDKELRAWDLVLGPSSGRREGLGDGWRSF